MTDPNYIKIKKLDKAFTDEVWLCKKAYSNKNSYYVLKSYKDKSIVNRFEREVHMYRLLEPFNLTPKLVKVNIEKQYFITEYISTSKIKSIREFDIRFKEILNSIKIIKELNTESAGPIETTRACSREYRIKIIKEIFIELNNQNLAIRFNKQKAILKYFDRELKIGLCLAHGDLHINNILFQNDKIKLIDFDKARYSFYDYDVMYLIYNTYIAQFEVLLSVKESKEIINKYLMLMPHTDVTTEDYMYLFNFIMIMDLVWWLKCYKEPTSIEHTKASRMVAYITSYLNDMIKLKDNMILPIHNVNV